VRAFVGVWLPPSVAAHLDERVALVRAAEGLRWVEPDRWHLTLTFLGETAPDQLAGLDARLGRAAARSEPFSLSLAGAGRFGHQVLWAGVAGQRGGLARLAERTTAAARRAAVDVEDRPFRPHLTLARARPAGAAPADRLDLRPFVERLRDYVGPSWRVDEVALIESRLGPGRGEPARYVTVGRYPLGRAAGSSPR
jgi:2'-5' RNA ligase